MTVADDLVVAVSGLLGQSFSDVWNEIRPMQFAPDIWDVWFEGPNGVSISVSVSNHAPTVRVLCDRFEFDQLPALLAPEFVAAVLTDTAVSVRPAGRHAKRLTMIVSAGGRNWESESNVGRDGPSDWERRHLQEFPPN